MARQIADLLIERLIDWGVDTVFGLPGDGVDGIFESLRTHQKQLRFIQVRHEEAAAFAACGYAKYSGRLGVCIATSGPGGIHLLNGLYDAKCDGQSVLAITGHTFHDLIGTHYQQDVDLDKLFMDVSVYNQRIMGAAHVNNVVDEAIRTAMSRARRRAHHHPQRHPGVGRIGEEPFRRQHHEAQRRPVHALLPAAIAEPTAARRRHHQCGQEGRDPRGRGALKAREEVTRLAETVAGPVVKPLLGKAVLPDRSPYTTGGIGLLGTAPSQDALAECDTLIMIGTSFPYMDFLPKPGQAKCVQIDRDSARLGLRHPVDVGLVGDSQPTLQQLLPLLKRKEDRGFLEMAQKRMKSWNELMDERGTRTDKPMKPQVVTHTLNRLLNEDAIVSSDSGTIATWAARYVEMRGDMKFSLSGSLATMAQRPALQRGRRGRLPRPPGRVRGRRRRLHHAHGRGGDPGQIQDERQSHHHQEQRPRPDQMGADGRRRQSRVRRRS